MAGAESLPLGGVPEKKRVVGNLRELLEELATGRYDLSSPEALRRLDLDRRIHEVFPGAGSGAARGGTPAHGPLRRQCGRVSDVSLRQTRSNSSRLRS